MAARHDLRAELDGLKDDLARPAPAHEGARPSAHRAATSEHATEHDKFDLAHLLKQIEQHLDEVADETEELVSAHPLTAISSAFAAGLLIGWFIGRR
ncbi:MAG: hypothetical protein HXY30_06905 [Pseudorhodoplanes sp.]|nr:hypothetical protein [Pseudorhodoplanes sp.]